MKSTAGCWSVAANNDQLDFVPALHHTTVEQFDARIRVYSEGNARALTHVDPVRMARRQKALAVVQGAVFRRAGAYESMRVLNIQPIVTDLHDIDEAIQAYLVGQLIDHTEKLH